VLTVVVTVGMARKLLARLGWLALFVPSYTFAYIFIQVEGNERYGQGSCQGRGKGGNVLCQ
jgi:hypothetical protein